MMGGYTTLRCKGNMTDQLTNNNQRDRQCMRMKTTLNSNPRDMACTNTIQAKCCRYSEDRVGTRDYTHFQS